MLHIKNIFICSMLMATLHLQAEIAQPVTTTTTESNDVLAEQLKKYKVSGFAFAVDPNVAFFVDTQDPEFTVNYTNKEGKIKQRTYRADINAIGLNIECAVRFDFIFIVDTDFNFYDSNKKIELGTGFEVSSTFLTRLAGIKLPTPCICILQYIPFKNMNGGMFTIAPSLGINGLSFSIITGGSLTPVN